MSNALLPMDICRQLLRALKTRYQAARKPRKPGSSNSSYCSAGTIVNRQSGCCMGLSRALTNGVVQPRLVRFMASLIVLWEASERLCGKRLKALLPQFIPAMEKHWHLSRNPALREQAASESQCIVHRSPVERSTYPLRVKSVTGRLTASVKVSRSECSPSISGILRDLWKWILWRAVASISLAPFCGRCL